MDGMDLAKLVDYEHWKFLDANALVCYVLGALFAYSHGPADEKYEKWARPAVAVLVIVLVVTKAASK
jgi:predicted ferric reductase